MQQLQPELIWFSGSGARIASHLGAAAALEDLGIRAKQYAGVSGGAIVATFAAAGIVSQVAPKALELTAKDLFTPAIFNSRGGIRIGAALLGLAIHGGRGMAELHIRDLIAEELHGNWNTDSQVWALIYDHVQQEVVREDGTREHPMGSGYFISSTWPRLLEQQASYPIFNTIGLRSDAGLTTHYPKDFYKAGGDDLFFSVAEKPNKGQGVAGRLTESLSRIAISNKTFQQGAQGIYIDLPSYNESSEYNPAKMKKSFHESYNLVLNELQQHSPK